MKCLIDNFEVNYPCSTACRLYRDCVAAFLKARKQNVRTNADRIRAMSDEELAKFIFEMQKAMCVRFAEIFDFSKEELNFSDDAPDLLNWLRQKSEED